MTEQDKRFIQMAIDLATENVRNGGGPFGAIVVKDGEVIATGVNRVTANNDPTAHAEVQAIRAACAKTGNFELKGCVLYTSCEPCPMCSGGIYWSNIGRCVFGITEKRLLELTGSNDLNPTFSMGADRVFAAGQKDIALEGPVPEVEEEIVEVHKGFWD